MRKADAKPPRICRVCGEEITGRRCAHCERIRLRDDTRKAVYGNPYMTEAPVNGRRRKSTDDDRTYDDRLREGFRLISRGGDC